MLPLARRRPGAALRTGAGGLAPRLAHARPARADPHRIRPGAGGFYAKHLHARDRRVLPLLRGTCATGCAAWSSARCVGPRVGRTPIGRWWGRCAVGIRQRLARGPGGSTRGRAGRPGDSAADRAAGRAAPRRRPRRPRRRAAADRARCSTRRAVAACERSEPAGPSGNAGTRPSASPAGGGEESRAVASTAPRRRPGTAGRASRGAVCGDAGRVQPDAARARRGR